MSTTNQTATKDEAAAPVSPVAEVNSDDAKSNKSEIKDLRATISNLSQKRRVFRQCQINYIRIKKSLFKKIQPDTTEEADKSESPKDPELVQEEKVSATHRLLRNFNFAVNVQTMERDDDKRVIPEKFAKEIEAIFETKDDLEKMKKALQTNLKEDQVKELPKKLSEKTLKNFAAFIEKHEKEQVLDKLEAKLDELTKDITEKKDKLKELRPTPPVTKSAKQSSGTSKKNKSSSKSKKSSKTAASDHSDDDHNPQPEERFRQLIKDVNKRVQAVKLKKDDFELYVKMQQEIDAFLMEAMTEIKGIKKRFKDKFDRVQASTDRHAVYRPRSDSRNQRRPRRYHERS